MEVYIGWSPALLALASCLLYSVQVTQGCSFDCGLWERVCTCSDGKPEPEPWQPTDSCYGKIHYCSVGGKCKPEENGCPAEIEDNDFDSPAPIIPDQEISPYEIGFCHNYGQISYKCEMTGDFGKSLCTETVTQSECDCNGRSNTTVTTRNYLNGEFADHSLGWLSDEAENVCKSMSMRCAGGVAGYSFSRRFVPYTICQERRNECRTIGGPDPGQSCVFPFKFQGKIYNECPFDPDDQSKTWCSTKVDSNGNHVVGQKKWGHCSALCPETDKKETYFSDFKDDEEVGPTVGIPQAPKIDLPICSRIDESWCESAKPDCSTSTARKSCPKYCELCQEQKCENKQSWCEDARPDCSMPTTKKNCQKYCGLCGGSSYPLIEKYRLEKKTKLCDYRCGIDGGCQVQYTGPPRRGQIMGSCFPQSYGGSCSGTPRECNDCNQEVTCYEESIAT